VTVVEDGYVVGSRTAAETFVDALRRRWDGPFDTLLARERELLTLLVRGSSDEEIARHMNLRPGTIPVYVRNIREKVGAANRCQLCYLAGSHGVI
jgi:DNA-binding NarL/FixJ family response regulator